MSHFHLREMVQPLANTVAYVEQATRVLAMALEQEGLPRDLKKSLEIQVIELEQLGKVAYARWSYAANAKTHEYA